MVAEFYQKKRLIISVVVIEKYLHFFCCFTNETPAKIKRWYDGKMPVTIFAVIILAVSGYFITSKLKVAKGNFCVQNERKLAQRTKILKDEASENIVINVLVTSPKYNKTEAVFL